MEGSPASRVVVAMSGGVDSSVAAALLKQQGYEVIGMMLRLWSESGRQADNRCCTPEALALARRVAARLGIPFYAVDAQQPFHDAVVTAFVAGYAQGQTPNPCLVCNRHIRWGLLLEQALALGADYLATGHYARLRRVQHPAGGESVRLLRAVDLSKDQSYVLHVLDQPRLRRALFPLGEYTKPQVRALARQFGLAAAERPDSQDLCFLAGEDYRAFLQRQAPQVQRPGPILDSSGAVLGQHGGLAFYTIGQRKGLGVFAAEPRYVLAKDLARNALVVGPRAELGRSELLARPLNWINPPAPLEAFRAQVKIRSTARLVWASATPLEADGLRLRFDEPQRDITPGQAAVLYADDEVLGGGLIQAE
jgi:tRNA-specific 2-thiouridylase